MTSHSKYWAGKFRGDARSIKSISIALDDKQLIENRRRMGGGEKLDPDCVPLYFFWDLYDLSKREKSGLPALFEAESGTTCV